MLEAVAHTMFLYPSGMVQKMLSGKILLLGIGYEQDRGQHDTGSVCREKDGER